MAIKTCTPTSAGRRWQTFDTFEGISTERPVRGLVEPLNKTGGRNAYGRITSRHRGGGHKRLYRLIDFKRDKLDIPARVARIEYDPNRTTRIALLTYADGEKRYILARPSSRLVISLSAVPTRTSSRKTPCPWPTSLWERRYITSNFSPARGANGPQRW